MEYIIATGAVGMVGGILIKVVYDILAPKNGNGKIPTECRMKLDTLLYKHENQEIYMNEQRKERTESTLYLKIISETQKEIVDILRNNGEKLDSISRNGKTHK